MISKHISKTKFLIKPGLFFKTFFCNSSTEMQSLYYSVPVEWAQKNMEEKSLGTEKWIFRV